MVELPRVRLSSRLTFFFKFIFPTLWLLGFSAGTLALVASPNDHGMVIPFGAVTVIGGLFLSRVCFPLKTVVATQGGLIVSNFIDKVEIPYAQIVSIDENKWLNTRVTTIRLNADSAFGQEIRFQPYLHFLLFWRDHPAVVALRERVRLASERS